MADLSLTADASALDAWLAALAEALKGFPEFGHSVVSFLESGGELFAVYTDGLAASTAGHLSVRFQPSNGLLVLVSAFRARHGNFGFFEHLIPPQALDDDRSGE